MFFAEQNENATMIDMLVPGPNIFVSLELVFYDNLYRQCADRHMNLKFMRRVSERERAIRPFVIVKNKLMSVFYKSVLLLTMNFVITLSK